MTREPNTPGRDADYERKIVSLSSDLGMGPDKYSAEGTPIGTGNDLIFRMAFPVRVGEIIWHGGTGYRITEVTTITGSETRES